MNAPGAPEKPALRNKNGTFSETEIGAIISGVCDFVASFRGDHWHRTPKQCEPLARPLAEALAKMSPAMAKRAAELSLPVSIVMGGITVFGPAVMEEVEIAKFNAVKAQNARGGIQGTAGAGSPQPGNPETSPFGDVFGGWEGFTPGSNGFPANNV